MPFGHFDDDSARLGGNPQLTVSKLAVVQVDRPAKKIDCARLGACYNRVRLRGRKTSGFSTESEIVKANAGWVRDFPQARPMKDHAGEIGGR